VTDGSLSETSGIASTVATPTAAPAADRPLALSASLALRSLALIQHRIPWRILPIPPAPALFDQRVINVGAIR